MPCSPADLADRTREPAGRNALMIGAHILGEEASELIHIAQAMLHAGATVRDFIDATFNVPTRADAYKYAAYDALDHLEARARNEERRRAEPVLANTKRQLETVTRSIEAAETRTRQMSKKLRDVEALPGEQAAGLLGASPGDDPDEP